MPSDDCSRSESSPSESSRSDSSDRSFRAASGFSLSQLAVGGLPMEGGKQLPKAWGQGCDRLSHALVCLSLLWSGGFLLFGELVFDESKEKLSCSHLLDLRTARAECSKHEVPATHTFMMLLAADSHSHVFLATILAVVGVTYFVFCWMHLLDESKLSTSMARAQILNKMVLFALVALVATPWCAVGSVGVCGAAICFFIYCLSAIGYNYSFLAAFIQRVELVEQSAHEGRPGGRAALRRIHAAHAVLNCVWLVCQVCNLFPCVGFLGSWLMFVMMITISCVIYAAFAITAARVMTRLRESLRLPVAKGPLADPGALLFLEAAWAQEVLGVARLGVVLPPAIAAVSLGSTAGIGFMVKAAGETEKSLERLRMVYFVNSTLASVVDVICFYLLSGGCHAERPRIQIPGKKAIRGSTHVDLRGAWGRKVEDLASRSIDVAALLDFFSKLGPGGTVMPHFDPWRSTTNDVVRQAVIPLSRLGSGGAAYAAVLHPGRCMLPDTMVTHCWSNLFVHLVAAVLADALGADEYGDLAQLLGKGRLLQLREKLADAGTLQRRYWICAFCVNQHASICGGFSPEPIPGTAAHDSWERQHRDSVTGRVFQVCDCEQEKHFNDHPDECELDKFDAMLVHLASQVPHFSQLIAVDVEFQLFSRAWCVAELLQASEEGIVQRVQLPSNRELDVDAEDFSTYMKLSTLTVLDCEASRSEDKEAILAKIHDVPHFDSQLQGLIFGARGLLSRCFVGFGVLEAAVGTARRAKVVASRMAT